MRGIYLFVGIMGSILILICTLALTEHFQSKAECEAQGGVLYRSLCLERDAVILKGR